jgi:hypothetical protein
MEFETNENILNMLKDYINKIETNTLSFETKLLLTEFFVKNKIVNNKIENTENDWQKYTFLGYYIYEFLLKK